MSIEHRLNIFIYILVRLIMGCVTVNENCRSISIWNARFFEDKNQCTNLDREKNAIRSLNGSQ